MRPDKLSLLDLFEFSRRYVIPLYQRRYVWSRQKQWEPLWNDVQQRAEAVLRDERRVQPHFLGAVVWSATFTTGRQVPVYEVIDGQQRLTTFQLLLMAFRDVAQDLDPALYQSLRKLTENDGLRASEEERFKVWPTRFDQPAFVMIQQAQDVAKVAAQVDEARRSIQHVPALSAGYLYFAEVIREWLQDAPQARADALYQALRRHLQVVTIDLEEEDDPQVIFESLNARGEPLQPADLVRNFIFNDAAQTRENVPQLFTTYWQEFDEDNSFWRTQSARGRLLRDHLAWFLSAYLTVKLGEDVPESGIFSAFKHWWTARPESGQANSAEAGLQELRKYAASYERIANATERTRLGLFTRRLEAMDLTTLTPILLYLLTEAQIPEPEFNGVLDDLESYTVRRFLTSLGNKNYNRFFLQLLQDLRKQGVNRAVLRGVLSRGSGDSARWPDDAEVRQNLLSSPIYKRLRARGSAMLLEAIDLQLTTGFQERLHIADRLSVEHVLPQGWRTNWPAPAVTSTGEDAFAVRDHLLHTLGNLTLVTGKLNSRLSNAPYEKKRVELGDNTVLRINKVFRSQMTWDEGEIRKRGQELTNLTLVIWRGPDVTHSVAAPPAELLGGSVETKVAAVRRTIERLFPATFLVQDLDLGFELLFRDWSRNLKFQFRFEEDEWAESDAFRLGLYEAVRADDVTKADLQRAVVRVANRAELTFSEEQVLSSPSAVEVLLAEETDVDRLTGSFVRLLTLSMPALEKALNLHPITPRPAGNLLGAVVSRLEPLPDGYFPYSRNVRHSYSYQRVQYGGWDIGLWFQIHPKAGRVVLTFRSDLTADHPATPALERAWPGFLAAVRAAFPTSAVSGEQTPRVTVELTLPAPVDPEEVAQTLRQLIVTLHPLVNPVMLAVQEAEGP